ncbi:HlyD family type I secretion periplasmic adaptor subunit [Thalassotalea agarivorans]|uniref:Membrane fusion protein (MFP) family protein n=1 Tax=Thalassotalea agarivorans TaxID=349064 RepID=A0A1I0HB56_THASX|nr:HlyD family type I secretion periplasmic adaptor subunit [Thalassotalea agarivorans]SET81015.1 membrane fusion protein, adhesin transport system [Thalassotalea agarivorans]
MSNRPIDYAHPQKLAAQHARRAIWLIALFLIAVVVWAAISSLDEVVVGEGKVVPSSAVQRIENIDGGLLNEIYVQEGQRVEKGDSLLQMEQTRFYAQLNEGQHELDALNAQIFRLTNELDSVQVSSDKMPWVVVNATSLEKPADMPEDIWLRTEQAYYARMSLLRSSANQTFETITQQTQAIAEQQANISALRQRLQLLNKEISMTENVVESGAVAEMELIKLQREQVSVSGELNRARANMLQLEAAKQQAVEEHKNVAFDFLATTRGEINQKRVDRAKVIENIKGLQDKVDKTHLRSPVTGTVKNIVKRSIGGVIEPGQPIMEIVPLDDQLIVETRILPKDIAFIAVGMPAKVKLTAFDFVVYGGLEGDVVYVSADVQQTEDGEPYYEAHIKTHDSTIAQQSIIPGMQASVDILIGKKTVLQYWLKPLLRAKQTAMREP